MTNELAVLLSLLGEKTHQAARSWGSEEYICPHERTLTPLISGFVRRIYSTVEDAYRFAEMAVDLP